MMLFGLSVYGGGRAKKFEYGVSFSQPYAENLGLDWKQVYEATLTDLQIKLIRLPAYWNKVNPQQDRYEFADLDYQLDLAASHNAKVVLAVGRRLPRWPECHEPEWLKELSSQKAQENALLSYIETVVTRYYSHPAVYMWQVENEPFLSSFGECPKPDKELLDREIALVNKLDPSRQVLVTDSGELSSWLSASNRGDVFGTTLYRFVFSDVFNRYWVNYIPYWFYRVKAGYVRLLHPEKQVIIAELQAEPWTTKGITKTEIDEQFKTMSMDKFNKMISVAKATGFSPQYLWGAEWWYWMKEKGHPEYWDRVKTLNQ